MGQVARCQPDSQIAEHFDRSTASDPLTTKLWQSGETDSFKESGNVMTQDRIANEPLLDDSYPVFARYWSVMDGVPKQSDISGDVRKLKSTHKATEVRRCDAVARDLPLW